jgi:hypothetical protein
MRIINRFFKDNKTTSLVYLIRIFDYFLKFSLIIFLPFLFSFEIVGEINLFLSYTFLLSIILNLGFNTSSIKKISEGKFNKHKIFFYYIKCLSLIFIYSFLFFILFIFINQKLELYLINSLVLLSCLFISSYSFTIVLLTSSFLRALGNFYIAQVIIGILIYLPLNLILLIEFFNSNTITNINDFIYALTIILIFNLIFSFLILIFKIKNINNKNNNFKSKINFNIYHYLDTIFSQIFIWVPIIIFSIYVNSNELGRLSTYYRLGIFLIGSLSIIDFLISKEISKNFNLKKFSKISKIFLKYKKIQQAILLFNSISLIFCITIINSIKKIIEIDIHFIFFFIIIIISQCYGPLKAILLFTKYEKDIVFQKFLILIVILISSKIFFLLEVNSNYILNIISLILLIDYTIMYFMVKRRLPF